MATCTHIERTAPGETHPLAPLLAPRSIAFVGASPRPDTPGNDMMRMVLRGGFKGALYAVNPNYAEIEGYPCYPSLAGLPEPVDLAVLSVANERLEAALADAIAVGARAAVIFASCYLENDSDPPLSAAPRCPRARRRACRSAAATAWASTTTRPRLDLRLPRAARAARRRHRPHLPRGLGLRRARP